ncbi:heavy metal-associated domain protein [Enterococcus italicus DSM 15952]|uniref:Copper chaperone CopZ n=2 Tax=Enterococcus italicus TaxID=246144 RepID=E6LGB1_ENTI1|nr:cation transporter [Enterococcus italicus]EFU73761.1 heavy metal-associated domain protein [Enterococcus italicus DSM 15952]OJG56494.1 hypothetical protein RT43_GL001748 [Enterococcus italicus DSM 15952]
MISKYNLYGMTCAVCATTIEKKIHELDGVYFAKVNLTTEVLKLEYDEGVLSNHTVITAIQDIGYDAEIRKKNEIKVFGISGMNCSGCATKVRNALEAEPTVSVKIVDLARGTVTFDADSKLTLTFLNQLLKNTKYTVTRNISI